MNFNYEEMEKPDIISKYRDALMGFAMLWIVFDHSGLNFGTGFLGYIIRFIKQTGWLGVDIFFFVSGFGLMVGWYKKKSSLLFFYKRRFLRIMPIFWFFFVVDLILQALSEDVWSPGTVFINFTGLSFFIQGSYHWFISAILLCYLIFPFFANYFQKSQNKLKLLIYIISSCLIFAIIISASELLFANELNKFLIVILRLPAFFIGAAIGYIYINNDIKFKYIFKLYPHVLLTFFCYATLALIFYITSAEIRHLYGLFWYPFVISAFSLTFLLSFVFSYLHQTHLEPFINYLNNIGKSSLDLYFIHSLLFYKIVSIKVMFNYIGVFLDGNLLWIFVIIISIILSLKFNQVFSKRIFS